MLRITAILESGKTLYRLEGKLAGKWVGEMRTCWTAMPEAARRTAILDLDQVSFIDCDGKILLDEMAGEGATFKACGPLTKEIVERIAAKHPRHGSDHLTAVILLALAFAGLSNAQPAAKPPMHLTLKDAVNIALKQNPQVAIVNLTRAQSEEDSTIARSALLPQVGLGVSDTVRRSNLAADAGFNFPGFPIPKHIGPWNAFRAGTQFSFPIFDFTLWKRYRAAKAAIAGSEADVVNAREQNVLLVVSQYLNGIRAMAEVNAAQSRAKLAQALFDQAGDLQRAGAGTGVDTLRSNVQLQNEKQRLLVAETQRRTTLYGLAQLLNLPPDQPLEIEEPADFATAPPAPDIDFEMAYRNRPELRALMARRTSLELQRQAESAQRYPSLGFNGAWSQLGVNPATIIPSYQYQLSLNVPVYTGGRIGAQVARAELDVKKIDLEIQDVKNRVALDLKTAREELESARNEVQVANLGIQLAQQVVDQARDRFQAGVTNNIEVVTAQDDLARANDNQIAALYRFNQSRANFARAAGQIESLYSK